MPTIQIPEFDDFHDLTSREKEAWSQGGRGGDMGARGGQWRDKKWSIHFFVVPHVCQCKLALVPIAWPSLLLVILVDITGDNADHNKEHLPGRSFFFAVGVLSHDFLTGSSAPTLPDPARCRLVRHLHHGDPVDLTRLDHQPGVNGDPAWPNCRWDCVTRGSQGWAKVQTIRQTSRPFVFPFFSICCCNRPASVPATRNHAFRGTGIGQCECHPVDEKAVDKTRETPTAESGRDRRSSSIRK